MRRITGAIWIALATICVPFAGFALADGSGMVDATHYYGINGVITQIHSGVLFVKTEAGLQPRTISPMRADRVGLHESKIGEQVRLWVDAGNILVNARRGDLPPPDHRVVAGTLRYTDPYWGEVMMSTPDGSVTIPVDNLAGSKLSVFQEGTAVEAELDSDNVLIDIHRAP